MSVRRTARSTREGSSTAGPVACGGALVPGARVRFRRLTGAALAVVVGFTLSACGAMPRSGPVHKVIEPTEQSQQSNMPYNPQAPRRGASAQEVVEGFLAAVQRGDLATLVTLLDPDIVLRADGGAAAGFSRVVRGAEAVVAQAASFARLDLTSHLVLVNGDVGVVSRLADGRVLSVIGYAVADGRVTEMNILADPARLARMDLASVEP